MLMTLEEQKRSKCVYFNGLMSKTCRAGVGYDAVKVAGKGLPCLRGAHPFGHGEELQCEHRRWPTEEEVAELCKASRESTERTMLGMAAVVQDAKSRGLSKGNGGCGEIACPVCKTGTIRYSVAGCNGHRHARCSTDGCVAFME